MNLIDQMTNEIQPKQFLIATVGISACGKTTWAKQLVEDMAEVGVEVVYISRDSIRAKLFGLGQENEINWPLYRFVPENENVVTAIQEQQIRDALSEGKSVVVANTHLKRSYVINLEQLVLSVNKEHNLSAEVVYQIFPTSMMTCIERDAKRKSSVGPTVIKQQYQNFVKEWVEPYKAPASATIPCVIIDIDGTVANMSGRSPFDWSRVGEDKPREEVIDYVDFLVNQKGYFPIFLSGRDAVCMEETAAWLAKHVPTVCGDNEDYALFMRSEGDDRPDTIVKAELFEKYVATRFVPKVVLDDRPCMVEMWNLRGLPTFAVANPFNMF
ncbi:putative polynucleotide 5'-kinase and 3'-phosphatase [Pseudoalteromonas phage J2-1_QLiu-2017]|nr:putative polynucleotide 5'-kinase and 3'-phosphatase [Pseudoalteromonas phage J2-1_QLiu-2017]